MSSSKVWLCNYEDPLYVPVFPFQASYPEVYDVVESFKLNNKEESSLLEEEKSSKQSMINHFLDIADKQNVAEYIEKVNMPTKLYLKPDSKQPNFREAIFRIATGMFVVNKACYDIMIQMNLGKTHFSQITFYDMTTQKKLTEIPYYFINLAEKNQFFDRKNSLGVRCGIYSQNEPERFIAEPKDDEIIVTKQALETNVDMWFDPLLHHSLFISNKLVQKLFQVGFSKKDLGLVSCQVK